MLSDAVLVFCRSNGLFVVPIKARRMGVNANVLLSPYLLPGHYLPDIFTYSQNVRTPLKGRVAHELFQVASTSGQTLCGKEETPIFASPSLSFPSPVCLSWLGSGLPRPLLTPGNTCLNPWIINRHLCHLSSPICGILLEFDSAGERQKYLKDVSSSEMKAENEHWDHKFLW